MLTDTEIQEEMAEGALSIEPFTGSVLQPASYDLGVGREAFVSGEDAKIDVASRGLVAI